MTNRTIIEKIHAQGTSDGDGVQLKRVFGGRQPERFDPFLMLDEFGSAEASDYIGGFPPHPHRGFETITYMLQGKMEHRDHMNNVGLLEDGGVQWMTAGKGVIHSEMPKQTEGLMRGFQLWLNLPSEYKMTPASYEDVKPDDIPTMQFDNVAVKAIAGKGTLNDTPVEGRFDQAHSKPVYWDIHMSPESNTTIDIDAHATTAMLYTYEGSVAIGNTELEAQSLGRLTPNGRIEISNPSDLPAKLLLIAGRPIKEPIAQYGPFVMNTQAEIQQAIEDYQAGRLTA